MALSALVLVAALLSGCGGSGSTSTVSGDDASARDVDASEQVAAGKPKPASGAEVAAPAGVAVVKTTTTPGSARVIADADGMTAYEFRRDNPMLYQFSRDPVPTCYGACAATWTPLLTEGRPQAKPGVDAAMLGTIKRHDGTVQVTYDGHPLYLFTGDRDPGDMNGQEADSFGAHWHAVEQDGDEVGR